MTGSVVYFMAAPHVGMVKIGVTTNLAARFQAIQTYCPVRLKVVATIPGDESMERAMHRRFSSSRAHYEWFRLTPEIKRFIDEINAGIVSYAPRPNFVEISAPEGRLRATPDQFFELFHITFGSQVTSAAARRLDVSRRTLLRWKAANRQGRCEVKPNQFRALVREVDQKLIWLQATAKALREPA